MSPLRPLVFPEGWGSALSHQVPPPSVSVHLQWRVRVISNPSLHDSIDLFLPMLSENSQGFRSYLGQGSLNLGHRGHESLGSTQRLL